MNVRDIADAMGFEAGAGSLGMTTACVDTQSCDRLAPDPIRAMPQMLSSCQAFANERASASCNRAQVMR